MEEIFCTSSDGESWQGLSSFSAQSSVGGVGGVDAKCVSNANGKELKTTDYNVKVKHKAKCECVGNKQPLWCGQCICLLFIK